MKVYNTESIRNIAFIGHGGSGKTSLSEVLLFTAGETNRIGRVEEGNTISDYNANEIERQISMSVTPLHLEWNDTKINILDTPGYFDFSGQVKSALKVVDTSVSFVKSFEGIEVGTESTWEFVKEAGIPSAFIINKCDNEHSKFFDTFKSIKERLSVNAVIVSFPVNEGLNFNTIIDLIKMKAVTYDAAGTKKLSESEIPADKKAVADKLREELIEKAAEASEDLMNNFFENATLSEEELKEGIKLGITSKSLNPVFACSAVKGAGMNSILDFISAYFPSPTDMPAVEAELSGKGKVKVACDAKGEPALFIYKSLSEQHIGELSLYRVYSGTIEPGMDLINVNGNKVERIGQVFSLNGKIRKELAKVVAGDLAAVVKLKDTHTNDTLASKNYQVLLPEIVFPEPVMSAAVAPKTKGDEDKISSGLHTIHEENPSLVVNYDPELAQTIISGQGELQLSLAAKILKDRYKVEVDLVEPRIPYRETIKGACADAEYKHKKQSGGRGQFGHVHLKLEPLPRGTGFEFVDAIVGGVVPGRFIPAVEKGIIETMGKGILTNSKVIDVKATLFFGSYHDVDSDEMSFKLAASQAFKKGYLMAKPVILEPIYEITVKVPEEFMGDVMGDISSKRGKIQGMDSEGPFQIIKAKIPLAEIYKYSTNLRSITSGRGMYSRKFSHYEEVPKEIEAKIIEEFKKLKEEE